MEIMHSLHVHLGLFANALKLMLESVSLFCVAIGLVTALIMTLGDLSRPSRLASHTSSVRLQFGTWVALALEFQLGADIVATTVAPTLPSLGELAILATVRAFLNFFLQKELEAEKRLAHSMPELVANGDKQGSEKT